MVKVKNKKNFGQADRLHAKKSQIKTKRTLNPFEVHINREKFKVLGKKSKNDWGLPGVSRAKALKKRKNTLGHELKLVNKTNTFVDKRIGEKNVTLSEEDRIGARFTEERIQQHKMRSEKQSIYNLAEDEILTHRGQTLEEIDKFDDPRSDDEEDEEMYKNSSGNLRDGFVADANFGGGVLARNENKDGAMSRKDLIEQLIIESKKRKMEKQKLKEETLDLTEKLDTEWKDLQPVVSKDFNKEVEKNKAPEPAPSLIDKLLSDYEKKNQDYDKMMRELKFEPRGTPSDRLKNEDEIAKIEKEKLEKLEQDRLARMHGLAEIENSKQKHRSADDLDDGYEVDSDPEIMVAYDSEGKVLMPERFDTNKVAESDGEEESEAENDDGEETEDDDSENEQKDKESTDNSDSDSLCDLREPDEEETSSDDENEADEVEVKSKKRKVEPVTEEPAKKKKTKNDVSVRNGDTVENGLDKRQSNKIEVVQESSNTKDAEVTQADKIKANLLARKAMMEKAASELPFTFEMPKNYEALQELLEKQKPDYQHIIVERIIKCNHPKLGEENKAKLNTLFAYLLQYLNDLFCDDTANSEECLLNSFRCFDRLACHYFDLAQMDTENTKNCIVEVIKEKFEEYKKKPTVFPSLDCLIFFKLISLLFPTSDLRHPVTTPCFIFLSLMLTTCKVKNNNDIAKGLFLTTLVSEYTILSKRILPAAINFVRGIFFSCVPTLPHHDIKVLRPFKPFGPRSNLLVLSGNCEESDHWKMLVHHLISADQSDDFKIRALVTSLKIFDDFFKHANDLEIQQALYEPHIDLLKRIPISKYPKSVEKMLNETVESMENVLKSKLFKPMVAENKKPKTLKLYEPAIQKEFSGKTKKNLSKEKIEHEKLVYRHKKEMKGALREIRKDRSFIGAVKIKEKIHSDNIRKQKVKQIYSEASLQQGELNALQRSKKKKK